MVVTKDNRFSSEWGWVVLSIVTVGRGCGFRCHGGSVMEARGLCGLDS